MRGICGRMEMDRERRDRGIGELRVISVVMETSGQWGGVKVVVYDNRSPQFNVLVQCICYACAFGSPFPSTLFRTYLIQIDVVCLKPPQALFHSMHNVVPGEALAVHIILHGSPNFRG